MYDFEGDKATEAPDSAGHDSNGHDAPNRALMFLELPRWLGEYTSSRLVDLATPKKDVGHGRPVLVLPGFSANDQMTGRLRSHLVHSGFRVHGWKLGRNVGLTDALVDGLAARFAELTESYDEPISLVGWSFGGLLARQLAHQHPDQVRQVITLGSPYRAEGEKTRATAMFEKSRLKHGIHADAKAIVDQLRQPVPVPTTSIWSKTDGIVPWRGCTVDERTEPVVAENIEVVSSHVGMVANPVVLSVVVDRLSQDLDNWQPHSWRRHLPFGASA